MATFKLNFGRIRGCPAPEKVSHALKEFGLPDNEEYGVLNQTHADSIVTATIARRTQQAVQKLDTDTGELTSAPVERVNIYPFAIKPKAEIMEVYAGSAAAIKQIGEFITGPLAISAVVEEMEIEMLPTIMELSKAVQRFVLKSVRVSDYSHNSYMIGPYSPKFMDSQHGIEFMEKHAAAITSAAVKFQGPSGKATLTITPKACFSYSCNEDDQAAIQAIIRKLI